MSVIAPIYTLPAKGHAPARQHRPATDAQDARISPLLVYPVVVAVSLLSWFALAKLVMLAIRLPLFS